MKTKPMINKFEIKSKKRIPCQAKTCLGASRFNKMNSKNTAVDHLPSDYWLEVYIPASRRKGASLFTGAFCRGCVDEAVRQYLTIEKKERRVRKPRDDYENEFDDEIDYR